MQVQPSCGVCAFASLPCHVQVWQLVLIPRASLYPWKQGIFVCLGCYHSDSVVHMWRKHGLSLICSPQPGAFWVLGQLSTACHMLSLRACQSVRVAERGLVCMQIKRNYGFVQYEKVEDATEALRACNHSRLMGE